MKDRSEIKNNTCKQRYVVKYIQLNITNIKVFVDIGNAPLVAEIGEIRELAFDLKSSPPIFDYGEFSIIKVRIQ